MRLQVGLEGGELRSPGLPQVVDEIHEHCLDAGTVGAEYCLGATLCGLHIWSEQFLALSLGQASLIAGQAVVHQVVVVATHMSDLAGSAALVEIEAVADSRVACGVCVHAQFQTFVLFNQLDVSGAGETGEWQENQKPSHITMVIKDVACVLMDSGTS